MSILLSPLALFRARLHKVQTIALIVLIAFAASLTFQNNARAQTAGVLATISNTAKIQWQTTTGMVERFSNQVDIVVMGEAQVMPKNFTFDSATGEIVNGVRITLLNADTNVPAAVYGSDGISWFPYSIVSGEMLTDGSGLRYDMASGQFLFPMVPPGNYRLLIEPPAPYSGPSVATAEDLARYLRPDGNPFVIFSGSFGGVITVTKMSPLILDIPLDRPGSALEVTKLASQPSAEAGDAILYSVSIRNPSPFATIGMVTVHDRLPQGMRVRSDSIRLNGSKISSAIESNGRSISVALPSIPGSGTAILTYVLEVLADAPAGDALNLAVATTASGEASNIAKALVRINRSSLGDRLTVIGRVIDADCTIDPRLAPGVAGVRIMLEDGSYAISDEDGRFHFEGLTADLHVVQMDEATLPVDRVAVDCARNTRSSGSATSRFVEGQNGSLKRVDFRVVPGNNEAAAKSRTVPTRPEISPASLAAGDRDWLTGQSPGVEWLFPEIDHNPRAPAVRVAIKHLPEQTVRLFIDNQPVSPVAFEGVRKDQTESIAISVWRGVNIEKEGGTRLSAEVVGADGQIQHLERVVHFTTNPARVELLRDRSVLIADGITRPVIALRLTDRNGRPLHDGSTGDFELPEPYLAAVEVDAQHARQLAGLDRARPTWRVEGDDGVAYVELEPTTASGTVSMRFAFRDGQSVREQRVEAWLDPGERPWTIVGLASGTIAFNRLKGAMKTAKGDEDELLVDGRIALYAKGRVKGKWLMTLAYDSDKYENARFAGTIDPRAYYTVYADRSERRYEASSIRKLYLRLERPQFYALFGDYITGIDEPALARYIRAFNGVKAEYQGENVSALAFAADTPTRHGRDDIQGNGTSGPYVLSSRLLMANSERVTIEVRDRLRSNLVIGSRTLTRYIDYDIDYDAGTIRFKEPILSRNSMLDPQFIIVEYEVDGIAQRATNAGARIRWKDKDETLQVGATLVHDEDDRRTTNLGGVDVRFRPNASTEIRAELAMSDATSKDASTGLDRTAIAWQVEAEHRLGKFDVLAYAHERESGFGVGQLSGAENGSRKIGADVRVELAPSLTFVGSGWNENYFNSDIERTAGRALVEYDHRDFRARTGLTVARDSFDDGRKLRSTIMQLGASKSFFDDALEVDGQTEFALGGKDESVDFAARHRISARYAVTDDVDLVGAYEIADGRKVDARTVRIGFDMRPWAGARLSATANQQDIAEYGPRSFAAFGLAQSLPVTDKLSVDFTVDGNKTLGGINPADVLNTEHPVASGGFVGGNSITEDFTAFTAGATYRSDSWTLTGRGEYRTADLADRYGFTAGALRQIGEGRAAGASLSWFSAKGDNGVETSSSSLQLSWAHRPAASAFSFLDKLELREDRVVGAVAGEPGPIGIPLLLTGDARSRRAINSLTMNYVPGDREAGEWLDRSEISLFWGTRYVSDKFGDFDLKGWSNLVGADVRFDISDKFDIGPSATVRHSLGADSVSYALGGSVGFRPIEDGWLSVGFNLVGFSDRDFEEARYTRAGPYVTMRFKFDSSTFNGLGLIGR